MSIEKVRLGTRGSPLALKQAGMVRDALLKIRPDLEIETVVIKTSGDWRPEHGEKRLKEEEGGKGLFAREIEAALLDGHIDAAVHSAKDMDSTLPEGLVMDCFLPREDPRDVLIINDLAKDSQKTFGLKAGAVIGTASVRRGSFLLNKRPDFKITPLRGNVRTRLNKLEAGQVDATLLALAGLKRLGMEDKADLILSPEKFIPAAGQGTIAIECRSGDQKILALFSQINNIETRLCTECERAFIQVLNGSCDTPIGAYAHLEGEELILHCALATLDGASYFEDTARAPAATLEEAIALGHQTGLALKKRVPEEVLRNAC